MRKYRISVLCLILASCLSEKNVDLAKPATFIRYFGDGYNNDAIAIEEIKDPEDKGFIILANSTIQDSEADVPMNRIILIKTNEFGDEQWRKYYPSEEFSPTEPRWVANSLTLLSTGGYLITGEEIQVNAQFTTKALVMKVLADGNGLTSRTYSAEFGISDDISVSGKGAVELASGNIVLLATSPVDNDDDATHLAEITSSLDQVQWFRTYVQGKAEIKNKLFLVSGTTPYLYWAGNTQQLSSSVDGFVTQSELDAASTENGQTDRIGVPEFNEYAGDFCERGSIFGYVGYTDVNDAGDIVFYQVNSVGHATNPVIYRKEIFTSPNEVDATNNKKETANAITPTNDSGYIILGTIDTYTNLLGRGNTDLLLLKIDGIGRKQWSKPYGSIDADLGVSIRQVSTDGGYAVLGTSRVAGQRTILLIKTDNKGEVQ